MRFVLSVAFKYLIPRSKQLSVSIISLISILVISLVVWLVIVFLSVTEGIEKNWVKQLVALNAPVRMVPTDAYYQSYYYQIDQLSSASNYTTKTIGEKLLSSQTDPYDPLVDAEIPPEFPPPDRHYDGSIKDLAKEGWEAIASLKHFPELRAQEYEVTFGNLRLGLLRKQPGTDEVTQTYLSQVSYVASYDKDNLNLKKLVLSPSSRDLNNLLTALTLSTTVGIDDPEQIKNDQTKKETLTAFFSSIEIAALKTTEPGYRLPRALFPLERSLKGCGMVRGDRIAKVIIPASENGLEALKRSFTAFGHEAVIGEVKFGEGRPVFIPLEKTSAEIPKRLDLFLEPGVILKAAFVKESLERAPIPSFLQFEVETAIQGAPLKGLIRYDEQLEIVEASLKEESSTIHPLWVHQNPEGKILIPVDHPLGEGILIAKTFQDNGVRLGDTGFLSYFSQSASGVQEQRLPVYVAGFYDPGFMSVGNKLILVDPKVTAILRGNVTIADRMLGNGVHIWTPHLEDAGKIKAALIEELTARGLNSYWTVESFTDYEFARPVLQQLKSDKTLFTLIAFIILIVACSNVISMLILLVNDKKKEIGILQSMGASSLRIASIFGVCGFFTGFISSLLGTFVAVLTLKNLQSLVNVLNFLQGHQAFQSAFYGDMLPNQLSVTALVFVLLATTLISLLAGIAPAVKAARIRPTEILRSE